MASWRPLRSGQHHVREQKLDRPAVRRRRGYRFRDAPRFEHPVPLPPQNLDDQRADARFVIHHQYGFAQALLLGRLLAVGALGWRRLLRPPTANT